MEGMAGMTAITSLKPWEKTGAAGAAGLWPDRSEAAMFTEIFHKVVNQVYETQQEVEQKQYLLAVGQLDDAHTLPIAEAKAALSLDVMISLRNKAMESYHELLKMSI